MKLFKEMNVDGLKSFIPEAEIMTLLSTRINDKIMVRDILDKSLSLQRLEPKEMAVLLNADDPEIIAEIKESAHRLKQDVYGKRIVLSAPLYVGNMCINNCAYCGLRCSNRDIMRTTLSRDALVQEVCRLEDKGHKRLILVYGEHPAYNEDFIAESVRTVYGVKNGKGAIRRVNINAAPLDVDGYKTVKAAGIGTYQIFQETYHEATYAKVHPSGPKSNYLWRLYGLDRAMEAGIDDVGIGALFGLYHHKFEAMALLYHAIHLEERFNVGPHTISFPRIKEALNTDLQQVAEFSPNDEDFMHTIAVLRLAVPYTGMILTAREDVKFRHEAINYGVSQIDAGSDVGVGAYSHEGAAENSKKRQFELSDNRSLDTIIGELCNDGFIPSSCTACYRSGRTGEHFMQMAKPGYIKKFCTANALLTLSEYAENYASPETRDKCQKLIERELQDYPDGKMKEILRDKLAKVRQGKQDLYF